eukprot:COSAG02_NODE_1139_length_14295_cov_63.689279_4_plen_181_part_00
MAQNLPCPSRIAPPSPAGERKLPAPAVRIPRRLIRSSQPAPQAPHPHHAPLYLLSTAPQCQRPSTVQKHGKHDRRDLLPALGAFYTVQRERGRLASSGGGAHLQQRHEPPHEPTPAPSPLPQGPRQGQQGLVARTSQDSKAVRRGLQQGRVARQGLVARTSQDRKRLWQGPASTARPCYR